MGSKPSWVRPHRTCLGSQRIDMHKPCDGTVFEQGRGVKQLCCGDLRMGDDHIHQCYRYTQTKKPSMA